MRFGVSASIEHEKLVKKAGFDFIECTVISLQPETEDKIFRDTLKKYLDSSIPVEAFNIFIPSDLKITGEKIDFDRLQKYVEKALERVKAIGGQSIVFGSGGARNIPDGFSRDRAEDQVVQFLDMVADYSDPSGITIVIEPLYQTASNYINNLDEAFAVVKKVNRKSIRLLADFFHMIEENDHLENIVKYKEDIRHIHVSDNFYPPGTGQYPYPQFVDLVKRANYDGRISIEYRWNNFEEELFYSREFILQQFKQMSKEL